VRFLPIRGSRDVLAFHSTLGIWRISKERAVMLWKTGPSSIDLQNTSRADAWGGFAFLTTDKQPYAIRQCGSYRPTERN